MRQALLNEEFQCRIVLHFPGFDETAVSVIGVFTETYIRHDKQIRHSVFDGSNGLLDDPIVGVCLGAERIFCLRDSEQDCPRDSERGEFFRGDDQGVNRVLVAPGHGGNFGRGVMSVDDKHRIDKVVSGERSLADQSAQVLICAKSPRTIDRESAHSFSELEDLIS